jgi:DNA-binding transcriptional ArsR family regulator
LKRIYPAGQIEPEEPELDPALILKALGDTTRYAMVSLLAKRAMTAADIAAAMSLSRPTVSHHIHLLRDAGLLDEKPKGNTVLLSLRRAVLENLSDLVTRKLFEAQEEMPLKKTRTKWRSCS